MRLVILKIINYSVHLNKHFFQSNVEQKTQDREFWGIPTWYFTVMDLLFASYSHISCYLLMQPMLNSHLYFLLFVIFIITPLTNKVKFIFQHIASGNSITDKIPFQWWKAEYWFSFYSCHNMALVTSRAVTHDLLSSFELWLFLQLRTCCKMSFAGLWNSLLCSSFNIQLLRVPG